MKSPTKNVAVLAPQEISEKPRKSLISDISPGRILKPWKTDEKERLVEALQLYGKDWQKVIDHVGTRNY